MPTEMIPTHFKLATNSKSGITIYSIVSFNDIWLSVRSPNNNKNIEEQRLVRFIRAHLTNSYCHSIDFTWTHACVYSVYVDVKLWIRQSEGKKKNRVFWYTCMYIRKVSRKYKCYYLSTLYFKWLVHFLVAISLAGTTTQPFGARVSALILA